MPPTARSACEGAVVSVGTNLTGAPADALERLQGRYENEPGFLAVVFDGTRPVVIVDRRRLPGWEVGLAAEGVAVAPSCVDTELLDAVMAILPHLRPLGGSVSAGYDGLADSIVVTGPSADELVDALERLSPGTGQTAQDAIHERTLRVVPGQVDGVRRLSRSIDG